MPLRALFVGIDRYRDDRIRDLSGAKRDALALWALFVDTLKSDTIPHFVDGAATLASFRHALDQALGEAGADDTVVVFFAGHGTHEHQFVLHDSDPDRLADTTMPMQELADRFRSTRARAVLCVLDCCFSGGAPGRVLEESPSPRAPAEGVSLLEGQGRVILSACGPAESAYELPTTQHGLLTHALLAALQAEHGGSIAVMTDAVMASVRAEAGRLGVRQTPVCLAHIEGGLTIPRLVPGAKFTSLFGNPSGAKVGPQLGELSVFGLSSDLLAAWTERYPSGLNPLQLAAINDNRVLDGQSLFVIAPTSSGKTFVGELAAARALSAGRRAVFLFPYRALVAEKHEEFRALYGQRLGHRVIRCTGDYQDDVGAFLRGKYDLAVLTYEAFLALALSRRGVLESIGLVVVDEAHFIADPTRGINVELLLSLVLRGRQRGLVPQLVALSAVVGNLNGFDQWLGCASLLTRIRPVPLLEGVLDRSGTFEFLDEQGTRRTEQLLPASAIVQRGREASSQDVLVPLAKRLLAASAAERLLIFRNTKGASAGCAAYLANELGLPGADEALRRIVAADGSTQTAKLRECLAKGTAFHNADLTRGEREAVETEFRRRDGGVRALVATSTVAAGVNTPASTVVIVEHTFRGETDTPYSIGTYKNMAGRAGRFGYAERGRSILLADGSGERRRLFDHYVMGTPEPMTSAFSSGDLDTWVLRLFTQVDTVPRAEAPALLSGTFGGFLAARSSPSWTAETERQVAELLARMVSLGLVTDEPEGVRLSLLGRACGRSTVSFRSALQLVEMLRAPRSTPLTPHALLAFLGALNEGDATYTPIFKKGDREKVWSGELSRRMSEAARVLQRGAADEWAWHARCKRLLIVLDWAAGMPMQEIERKFTVNPYQAVGPGTVRSIADAVRFHLRSAAGIASVLLVERGPTPEATESLMRSLEFGVPVDTLPLLDLRIAWTRGELLSLRSAGLRSVSELGQAPRETLDRILGPARAGEVVFHLPQNGAGPSGAVQ